MDLEVRHLQMIRAIHRAGSVTDAAGLMGVSQPAVSLALGKLERTLGTRLFIRDPAGMDLTPEGERLLSTAETILGELERAERDVAELVSGQQGTIRVTTECYTCYHWLPGLLTQFREEFPGIDLRIVPEATHRPLAALREREADLAIVHTTESAGDLDFVDLFEDEQVALVAPDHPWSRRSHVEPADFAGATVAVHYQLERSYLMERVLRPAGVWPEQTLKLQLTEAVLEAVKAQLGVAVMARWVVAPHLKGGNLVAVPVTAGGIWRPWYAAARSATADWAPLRAFLRLLQEGALKATSRVPTAGGDRT